MNTRGSPQTDVLHASLRRRPRFSLANLPLKHRLPLLIGTLLLGIITVSIWTSYSGVKESALEVGSERLRSLTRQLANQTQQSLPIVLNRTFTVANDPAVRTFLRSPSSSTRPAAVSILQQFAPVQDPGSSQVELWNTTGSLVLTIPDNSSPESADLSVEFKQSGVDPYKAAGSIRVVKGVVMYTVAAAVKNDQGKVVGYLVRWRLVSPTANARKQLSDLLGSDAALYYGNSKGDAFTDLENAVPLPPVGLSQTLEVTHYTRDGNPVMAKGRPIIGTAWFLLVEFPERTFLAQAHRFLWRILMIGFVLLGGGIAAAFALSRSITRPLRSLTDAASAIGSGDYSSIVAFDRSDEVGKLANAFNLMLVKVRDAQRELQRDLSERTARLEAAPSAMLMVDDRGRMTLVNAQLEQLFGYPRAELLDQPVEMLVPERYRNVHPGHRAVFFQTPSARSMGAGRDLFGRRKDGTEIPIEIGLNPIKTDEGAFVLASIIDITERRRAEERFRLVVEASPSAMMMVDADGRITLVNTQTEKLFGYGRAELLGQGLELLVPERYRAGHPDHRRDLFRTPSTRSMGMGRDLFGLRKDGSEMPIEIGLNPINSDEGAFVLASIIDITERKRAEERFRQVIEGAPNGMVMVGREGKMALVNLQIEKSFGYSRDELLGQSIEMLVPKRFRGHHLGYRNGFMAEPSTRSMGSGRDLYGLRKDGSEFPVEIGLNPIETEQGLMVLGTIVDITERKRAQEKLRESEDQFRTMANSIPQLAWMAHADGFIFWYNQRWHDYTGKTSEQMEGWGWQSVHDPDVLPKVLEGWRAAIANEQPFEMKFPLLGADGKFRMFLTRVEPMKDSQGRVLPWFGTNTDVKELKQMEQCLRDTQTRLNSTLSAGSIGTWTWDIVNDCLSADEFTSKMFSIEPEAAKKGLPAEAYLRAIIDEDRPSVSSALEHAIQSCGNYDIEYRVQQKDGTLRWLQARGRVDCDAAGNGVSFHGAVMDITERKASQEELRRSQQQLAGVIGSAMDAIITVDGEQRIILFNAAAERMFLFPAEEAIGQSLDRFIPERFRAAHKGHIKDFCETRVTRRSMGALGPLYGLRADGEEFPIEASISQIESDGKSIFTVILRDIAERKHAEEALNEHARIVDLAPVMIRDLNGRISFWNTGVERMFGWTREEAIGEISHSLLHTEFPRPLEEIKARLFANNHWEGELLQTTKDGEHL